MLILREHIDAQRAGGSFKRSTGLAVGSALVRPAEVIRNRLPEVIAVCQRWSADRNSSHIKGIEISGKVVAAAKQVCLISKFLLQPCDETCRLRIRWIGGLY